MWGGGTHMPSFLLPTCHSPDPRSPGPRPDEDPERLGTKVSSPWASQGALTVPGQCEHTILRLEEQGSTLHSGLHPHPPNTTLPRRVICDDTKQSSSGHVSTQGRRCRVGGTPDICPGDTVIFIHSLITLF